MLYFIICLALFMLIAVIYAILVGIGIFSDEDIFGKDKWKW